jgi:tetratricopeptide (TPR) repeat protein
VLKDSELLYERGILPQSTYIFKHALTREVIYDSILSKRKKQLHEETGNAIEDLYKENINEHYAVLAEHYIEAESYEKGAEYSRLAGRKAEKAASFIDAVAYGEKRISCLEKLPVADDVQKKIIDARTTLGLYRLQLNLFFEAKEAVDPITDLAIKLNYERRISQIYTIIGTYNFYIEQDLPVALKNYEEALKISEEIEDTVSSVFANLWLGGALLHNCEFKKAYYHLKKALDINVAANSIWGISVMKSIISLIYNIEGKIDLGYQTSDEALCLAEESGDIWSKSYAHIYHGLSYLLKGFVENGREHFLKGINLCEKINLNNQNANAHQLLGEYHFEKKEYQKSVDYYEKAIQILEENVIQFTTANLVKILIARSKVMDNEKEIDLESLYGYVYGNKVKIYDGLMPRYIGEILLNIDDQHMSEAEDWIKKAIKADQINGMMWHLGRDYALYAELFKRKGDQSKARENIGKAIEILKECGADGWVEKYEKELVALS